VFTTLVAIGVAIEVFVVVREHKEELDAWRVCVLHPKKPSRFKLFLEIASIVLVTVGILGELGIGLWISHINGQLREKGSNLRSKSDQLLALVTQEAGDAKTSATDAAESAQEARDDAEELRTFLVKLADAIRPQSMSLQESRKMANEFRPFAKPHVPIHFVTTEGPPEALAIMIANALKEAGFDQPTFEFRTALYPGIQMGGPISRRNLAAHGKN
jgi:hypothetical protein